MFVRALPGVLWTALLAAPLWSGESAGIDEGASEGRIRDAGAWVEQARADAAKERFNQALAAVDSALAAHAGHFEARVLKAKILSWQGRFGEAESAIRTLLREKPGDPEATLSLAYIRYYQGRLDRAETGFRELLAANPDYGDAKTGLQAVLRAKAASHPPRPPRWRVDAGGEISAFTRREQTAWNQQFVQLGRRLPNDKTTVYARLEHYRQFEKTDVAVGAGVHHALLSRLNTVLAAGWTFAPDFRPDWRLAGEAEFLALPAKASRIPAAWLLAGVRYDVYENAELVGLNPGLRLDWDPWAFTARLNRVRQAGDALYGWTTRLDGPLPPMGPAGLRFWAGYADAPETLARAGAVETILTRSLFAGIGVELGGDWLLNAGYTRDDREDSWVRHAFHAHVARKF